MAQTDPSNLLVCGTNSFNPRCRTYTTEKVNTKKENLKLKTDKTKNDSVKESKEGEAKLGSEYNGVSQDPEEHEGKFRINHEFSGKGSCPHDPRHNSTAIFTGSLANCIFLYKSFIGKTAYIYFILVNKIL